ncbi:MAG: NAD(P)H-hydrate dehydratase, partial [Thermoplasmata archaeon]|nr:NAD(P)H-hydrate dehydratase [Thermoplasmata archaeon]
KRRDRISHKGTYGKLFVIAGSRGFTGAAALSAAAAMRAGSGLVYLGIPQSLNPILETKLTETITLPLPETSEATISAGAYGRIMKMAETSDCAIVGPGISTNAETAALVKRLLENLGLPLVIDADGLNCIGSETDYLRRYAHPLIVTPHPGEMSRLCGLSVGEITKNAWKVARDFAVENSLVVILKGAQTVVAQSDGKVFLNITGHAGIASGGTGDVLTGIIGSLVGQGYEPNDAAKLAVFLHGRAAELSGKGDYSLIASDIIEALPAAFAEIAG